MVCVSWPLSALPVTVEIDFPSLGNTTDTEPPHRQLQVLGEHGYTAKNLDYALRYTYVSRNDGYSDHWGTVV